MLATPIDVHIANHMKIKVIGVGSIPIVVDINGQPSDLMLLRVLHVPRLSSNLFSLTALIKKGFKLMFDTTGVSFVNPKTGVAHARAVLISSLFFLRSVAKMAQHACTVWMECYFMLVLWMDYG